MTTTQQTFVRDRPAGFRRLRTRVDRQSWPVTASHEAQATPDDSLALERRLVPRPQDAVADAADDPEEDDPEHARGDCCSEHVVGLQAIVGHDDDVAEATSATADASHVLADDSADYSELTFNAAIRKGNAVQRRSLNSVWRVDAW